MIWRRTISSVAAVAVTCLATAAAYYYKKKAPEINEVMVFSKLQYNVGNYFEKLMGFLERAKKNVVICMPGIQNVAIQGRLVALLKKKKIRARIIIDKSGYNDWSQTFLKELKEAGAVIKWTSSESSMGHKFCLIDEEILMTGTLNWGDDLSADDWNYVLITTKQKLVAPINNEFNHLWQHCQFTLV